ncbi:hypothetical protein QZH41_012003 [Actinostola sp. cb2023]|nr:hypothetical protein QZH41_012003 [Actinostola sp. cb2023]
MLQERYGTASQIHESSIHTTKKRKGNNGEGKPVMMPREEVIRRLRERGEPIRLFGETNEESYQRQRRIEMMAPEINKGFRNDFKAAMESIDQEYLTELIKQGDSEAAAKAGKQLMSAAKTVTLDDIKGKLASATHRQTQAYLNPLMRKLRTKANDAYLQMAIGNAPWPIGVTMVGIHARTGREKIFSQNVAHEDVLNDETQRKYIQGLKRVMTFCQKKFPADPSKSVEYHGVV